MEERERIAQNGGTMFQDVYENFEGIQFLKYVHGESESVNDSWAVLTNTRKRVRALVKIIGDRMNELGEASRDRTVKNIYSLVHIDELRVAGYVYQPDRR
mgnify:CR=1 FL=1